MFFSPDLPCSLRLSRSAAARLSRVPDAGRCRRGGSGGVEPVSAHPDDPPLPFKRRGTSSVTPSHPPAPRFGSCAAAPTDRVGAPIGVVGGGL